MLSDWHLNKQIKCLSDDRDFLHSSQSQWQGRLYKIRNRVPNRHVVAQIFLWLGHEDMAATGSFTEKEEAKRNLEFMHKIATTIDPSYVGKFPF